MYLRMTSGIIPVYLLSENVMPMLQFRNIYGCLYQFQFQIDQFVIQITCVQYSARNRKRNSSRILNQFDSLYVQYVQNDILIKSCCRLKVTLDKSIIYLFFQCDSSLLNLLANITKHTLINHHQQIFRFTYFGTVCMI